jgi:DDE family transposase
MKPTFDDYIALIYNRFEAFVQSSDEVTKLGNPYTYQNQRLIAFFMWMQFKKIYHFKTQWRWLGQHPKALVTLDWESVPSRSTISRRYKALYVVIQEFSAFLGQNSEALGEEMSRQHLNEDQSLFKAQGTVWHQSDRKIGRIPEKLRNLDQDATWSKSGYHGWVYGYGIHLTTTQAGFPVLLEVETAAFSEKDAIERKENTILNKLKPDTVCGDDAYTKAMRIREWAKQGVILVTPALRWRNGKYAKAYRQFIKKQSDIASILRKRKTAIEPIFDLISKLLGTSGKQKQLFRQGIENVRTHLGLGVLSLQIAMIANNIWNLPFRTISHIKGVFA